MIEVTSQPDLRRARELFLASPRQPPSSLRVYAILNGDTHGHIFVDDPAHPTWAAAHEVAYDRTLYLAGALTESVARAVLAHVRQGGDAVLCLWRDAAQLAQWLPPPDYDGEATDFTQRGKARTAAARAGRVHPAPH